MTTEEEKMNPDTPPAKGTEYVVLGEFSDDATDGWREVGRTSATSKDAAVKAVTAESITQAGNYKAVPARSWNDTVVLDVQTITKVTAKVV